MVTFENPIPALPLDSTMIPPINNVPIDIIYYLLCNFDFSEADKASLALTCKLFWDILDGTKILEGLGPSTNLSEWPGELVNTNRMDFLQRLSPKFPSRQLCGSCATFHYRPFICPICSQYHLRQCDINMGVFLLEESGLFFTFSTAQAIMNYHRYGEKYGFHVDQLECNFGIPDDTLHPDQWMCFKLSATIVDDELLVMLDYSSLFYLDQPDSLKAAEEKIRGPHHSLCASHGFQHLRNWTEEYFVKAYRCRKCSNEVRDTVDFNYGPGQGETRRTMWCNLGRCADSNDRKWCMATLAKSSRCRYGASSLRKSIYADFFDDRSPRKTALKLPGKIHEHFRSRRRFPPFPCSSF